MHDLDVILRKAGTVRSMKARLDLLMRNLKAIEH